MASTPVGPQLPRPNPVRVGLRRLNANVEKPYPPAGDAKEWCAFYPAIERPVVSNPPILHHQPRRQAPSQLRSCKSIAGLLLQIEQTHRMRAARLRPYFADRTRKGGNS
jgi:hypothetical protein